MRAPANLVRTAYERARGTSATHILMIWYPHETAPHEWVAMTVDTPEQLAKELACPGAFAQLREVYSMQLPLEEQLDRRERAWFVA